MRVERMVGMAWPCRNRCSATKRLQSWPIVAMLVAAGWDSMAPKGPVARGLRKGMWFARNLRTTQTIAHHGPPNPELGRKDRNSLDRGNDIERLNSTLAGKTTRRQAFRLLGGGILGSVAGGFALSAALKEAAAQPTSGGFELPQVVLPDGSTATLSPTQFINDGGVLSVVGDVLNAAGDVIGSFTGEVNLEQTQASCDILTLVLGPLFLDVLGLVVEIPDPVTLLIYAVPGQGNLLGNLLCAVAHLLDGPAPAGGLAALLNRILRALGLA
jgi:hypothetical protein